MPADVVNAEVSARFDVGSTSASVVPVVLRLHRIMVTDRLVLDRAIVVLRDVFRLQPGDVRIAVPVEDSECYDDEDWPQAQ